MNLKKSVLLFAAMAIIINIFAGCRINEQGNSDDGKLKIISSVFASYDFAKQVVGDKGDVSLLLAPGVECHSYEPTAKDIIDIMNCDVFIYVGGDSEEWIGDVLKNIDNDDMEVIVLTECVDLVEEEITEGMQTEHEHEEEEHTDYDNHVWTSPVNAIKIVDKITDTICSLDEENSEYYKKNAADYIAELSELDSDFREVCENGKRKTVVFGDRFPLRYFVEEYDLEYYAAFPGCSGETEPSSATVTFLVDKIKQDKIPVVFCIELSNGKMADIISEATGAKKIVFNSCHNITKDEFEKGETYLSLMRKNVGYLQEALN